MYELIRRLNSDNKDQFGAMLVYARFFNLPFVEEDIPELMEFWVNIETHVVSVSLVLDETNIYDKELEITPEFAMILGA
ncbi:MAG: hypothetical protein WC119_00725 [Synergistaceae bacterium]